VAYSTYNDRARGGASLGQTLSTLTANLAHRFAQVRAHRSTLRELAQLSDRELADIGIHRANIGTIAQDAAYRA
jgi:uncharacterized protein YjiS (DUF1127 family)